MVASVADHLVEMASTARCWLTHTHPRLFCSADLIAKAAHKAISDLGRSEWNDTGYFTAISHSPASYSQPSACRVLAGLFDS
jgi:hypothetical protein